MILVIILLAVIAGCGGRNKQSTTDVSNTVDDIKNYPENESVAQNSVTVEHTPLETNNDITAQDVVPDNRPAGNDEIIMVDVRRNYSSTRTKELVLQDFMDVEYVALETNDEFLNQGFVQDIGKEIILVINRYPINDGDIFFYDRNGKALRIINRKGQGPEEYLIISSVALDEDNGEIFVNDIMNRKFLVYDLYGKFKRNFYCKGIEDVDTPFAFYSEIFNYDKNNLICNDAYNENGSFVLISKHDGSITQDIKIPFKEKKFLRQIPANNPFGMVSPSRSGNSLTPYKGNWILVELSSDTVYTLLPDFGLHPLLIRTPSIQSMNPEVFLMLRFLNERYFFLEIIRNEYNFNTNSGFPRISVMYDKHEKAFFDYSIYNGDYSTKKGIYINTFRSANHEIASWLPLESYQLVESFKKGELKDGRLKEIAAKLDAEDNPVIMLIKHKK